MKRAVLFVCLLMLTTPALAQAPSDQAPSETGGPITNQAERDATAVRVRGGASCTGCDLFQIDLAYQSIAGRNFTGARLRQSNLSVVIADRANFTGANMSLANLFAARASGANFTGANLSGAGMIGGYYGGARFTGALLTGANLSGAEMADAQGLTQAQLAGACGDDNTTLPATLTIPTCD